MNTIRFDKKQTQMIAHRGVSGLEQENTLCAFVAAGNRSYFGVETDVHCTADGQFVIIHDDTTKRVAGDAQNYRVEETDLATLRTVTLLDMDGKAGRVDLRLPTLAEYLQCCKKYDKTCVLELKNPFQKQDIFRMVEEIRAEGYLERVIFISFCTENVLELRRLLPGQTIQLLTSQMDEAIFSLLCENRLDLDVGKKGLTKEWVDRLHAVGRAVNVWTVNDPTDAARFAEWGVDYITTNILE